MIADLGLLDSLVGVSEECRWPPEVVGKPVVTAARLDPATLSSLEIDEAVRDSVRGRPVPLQRRRRADRRARSRPDRDAGSLRGVRRLERRAGDARVPSEPRCSRSIRGRFVVAERVSRTRCRASSVLQRAASEIVAGMWQTIETAAAAVAGLPRRRVFFAEWIDPPFCAGHWLPEMIALAGGIDVLGRAGEPSYPTTWDEVIAAEPELVVIAPCGFGAEEAAERAAGLRLPVPRSRGRRGQLLLAAGAAARRRRAAARASVPSGSRPGSRPHLIRTGYPVSMFSLFRDKTSMVEPDGALPGRDEQMTVPARHEVLGTPLRPPFPEGFEQVIVGMGCFWGAERVFWRAPGVYTTAVGYAGGYTPNPTYEETCSGRTGHTEAVLVVFDPAVTSYEEILRLFWENHDPTQGARQGNDVGTQYRSAILWTSDAQKAVAERSRDAYQPVLAEAGYGPITTELAAVGRVLLRGALPPAVPREEPERLLRPRRHGRVLPDRAHHRRLTPRRLTRPRPSARVWAAGQ